MTAADGALDAELTSVALELPPPFARAAAALPGGRVLVPGGAEDWLVLDLVRS